MKMLEYIHATLIVMLVLPVMYAVAGLKDADGEGMLYLKCLLIAVPIVVTGIAVRRLKNLGLYLLSCLAVTTAIWVVIRLFFGGSGALYPTVMTAESLFIGFIRFQERIRLARQEKEDDLYSAPAVSMLNQPSLGFLWYFAVMYAVGIIFNAKTLCDFAFWNGAVYFFAALAYAYQISTKHYLGQAHQKYSAKTPVCNQCGDDGIVCIACFYGDGSFLFSWRTAPLHGYSDMA